MIRDAVEADSKAISEIYNYYIRNTVITFEEQDVSAEEISRRIAKVQASGLWWLVIEVDNAIAGYAYCSKWQERSAYRKTVEVSVYLAHSATGKGLGTKLYEELFQRLKNSSFHVVIGGIALPNPASVALHERFNMKKVSHFEEVGYKFSKWVDVGHWQLKLNA
ncbi:MAG: GNAT family N-acetyltransferase [Spongiibacteraceae bacterium]